MVKEFNKSYNIVYIKCHEAAIALDFNITKEDISEGIILFKVGASLLSWGEKFRISLTSMEKNLTKVEMVSDAAFGVQLIDWGKNHKNIQLFFKTLNELLTT